MASKQAEAQSVMAQITELDGSLERAVEAYNLANVKLAHIRHDLSENTSALATAKKSLKQAQNQLSARLVDIYTSGDNQAGLAVLLGASSLDDALGRMDAESHVSDQDTLVLGQVAKFRREVQHRQRFLQHAPAAPVQVVAPRNAARASVESQLGPRKQLLGSIQGEIAHLQAQEAARQAELKRELEQRLATQQVASRQATLAPTVPVAPPSSSAPPPVAPPPTHGGVVGIAALYGPFIWLVMSLIVIPMLLHRPPKITGRWWIQLLGHIPFVGLPIVASIADGRAKGETGQRA